MARSFPTIILMLGALAAATPAVAQFGSIFGNDPPRPPGSVPGRPPVQPDPFQRDGLLPPGPPPGRIQSQPLPPPPGATAPPPAARSAPPAAAQPSQRPVRPPPQPASTGPQPSDGVIVEPPAQKITNSTAVFAGLDKITGRIISFDVAIDETVRFGALEVTPRACYTRPPTETPNTDAFIEVDELTLQGELRRIFSGWMFAASPGLNAVEHPIYDIWLTDCKGGSPPAVTAEAPKTAPVPPQRPTQRVPRRNPPPQLLPPPPPPSR